MEAKAIAKYVRMSPIKLKPVADLVRGKDLNEALTILKFTPGKGSEIVEKVALSAAANAENNFEMDRDNQSGSNNEEMESRSSGQSVNDPKEIEPCKCNSKGKRRRIGGS